MSFRRDYCFDQISGDITEIVLKRSTRRWKPCPHRSCHVPSRAARKFCARAHAPPRAARILHAPPRAVTRPHAHPRAVTRQVPLVDVSPKWRHHCHVTTTSFADVTATSSADVILDQDVDQTIDQCWLLPLTLTYAWLWPLTFCQIWLLQSRCSLPSFSCRFQFCSLFLHILLLNEE